MRVLEPRLCCARIPQSRLQLSIVCLLLAVRGATRTDLLFVWYGLVNIAVPTATQEHTSDHYVLLPRCYFARRLCAGTHIERTQRIDCRLCSSLLNLVVDWSEVTGPSKTRLKKRGVHDLAARH